MVFLSSRTSFKKRKLEGKGKQRRFWPTPVAPRIITAYYLFYHKSLVAVKRKLIAARENHRGLRDELILSGFALPSLVITEYQQEEVTQDERLAPDR
jgi:hypothetical protein